MAEEGGALRAVDDATVAGLRSKLLDNELPLPARYRALYALRSAAGDAAGSALRAALDPSAVPSALLRHDVAFCLGQRQDASAVEALVCLLGDASEHPMVRHEAGEALGAIGTEQCLAPLRAHQEDACPEVAETCQLALQRVEHFAAAGAAEGGGVEASPYMSVDPTPPAPADTPTDELRRVVLDDKADMFQRYRALFALRNRGGPDCAAILTETFACGSALLKHEVAYVLGQMLDGATTKALVEVLGDSTQAAMVRHEAAEALGAIAQPWTLKLLQEYAADPEPIVADSCVVALDMLAFEESGGFEYADTAAAQPPAEVPVSG
mmetsp:Transcript_44380/g.112288  ORF Transcript_44380/g.112288 Transcript_44380/m.112288 type:complete len:324 (-) Transcript_44380:107-1078(-)